MSARQLILATLAVLLGAALQTAGGQTRPLVLDDNWQLLLDPGGDGLERGLERGADPAWRGALEVVVPGVLEQLPETAGYDGVVWYRSQLPAMVVSGPHQRLLLEFAGANYRADVWLGGEHLGRHDGSDAPFSFDVTGRLGAEPRVLVVRVVDPGHEAVDGLVLGALPHAKESWYFNYGGLTGAVSLRSAALVEAVHPDVLWRPGGATTVRLALINHSDAPRDVRVSVGLAVTADELNGLPWLALKTGDAPRARVTGSGGVAAIAVTALPGRTTLSLKLPTLPDLAPWHPDRPTLHDLRLAVVDGTEQQRSTHAVGLRHFTVDGDHFVLNDEPLTLRGVLYQPYHPAGLANPPHATWLRDELLAIKAAGFNLVRAHIRVMPEVYALCDTIGLLCQAEPTLGWITAPDEHTLPAVDAALSTLADAVAGHPSVVMIGLLNEMSGELFSETRRLLLDAAALMPGLLILDDSGSWQGSAHYLAPGSLQPVPYDDLHVYRSWPWTKSDLDFAANLGADHQRLIYVSEYGYGGLPNFRHAVVGFERRYFFEDAKLAVADARAARKDLERDRLRGRISTLDELSRLGGLNQARAAEVMAVALRANPRIAGDTYTQWRDAAWECGAGLVDLWGRPKPALAAMAALNALPQRPGADHLSRDTTPPPRPRVAVARGPVLALTGREAEVVRELVVSDDAVAEDGAPLPRLVVLGRRPAMWGTEGLATTVEQLRFAYEGGVLLMLEPPDAGHPFDAFFFGYDGLGQVAALPFDVQARNSRGHFIGRHLIFAQDSLLLEDLGLELPLIDERLATASPHRVLDVHDDHGAEIALDCLDGYGLSIGAAVQSVPFGKGRIVLSTLRFDDDSLQQPMVERLLENVVRYAADQAAGLPAVDAVPVAAPTAEVSKLVGRGVWKLKIWFGLAERLALQTFNGVRAQRNELPRLPAITAAKIAALSAVIQGRFEEGQKQLADTAQGAMTAELELFLRKELKLSAAFYRPAEVDPAPRNLSQTLAVGRAYALALVDRRGGHQAAALARLDHALELVAALGEGEDPPPR